MSNICVFCGSSVGGDPAYRKVAVELGSAIAAMGHGLVYGGGDVGLMGATADAVLTGGGAATGVITEQLAALELAHAGLSALEVVIDMHARKARMAQLADGVVVLPGGFGTFEEAFEILTWNQLGIAAMPVVFLDVEEFFEPLFEFLARAVDAGFVSVAHGALAQRTTDPLEAVRLATAAPAAYSRKWVG